MDSTQKRLNNRSAAETLRIAAFNLADRLRRCGPGEFSASELITLRAWMSTLDPLERVRVVFPGGASIIEGPIDRLWDTLGARPTADEYRALAVIASEAALYCNREALELDPAAKAQAEVIASIDDDDGEG